MKWVVVFAGARDKYEIPLALAEKGNLERLITDFYSPFDSRLGSALRRMPVRAQATLNRRYKAGVHSAKVKWSMTELVADRLLSRPQGSRDDRLGVIAGRLALANGSGLLSYSYYGCAAFRSFGVTRWPKVLMQVHPHPRSVRKILRDELEVSEFGRESLLGEHEIAADDARFNQLAEEALLADYCVVSSEFTKRTLIENGVPGDRIYPVPYGVDLPLSAKEHKRAGRFRVVFVGQMVQRKGLEYLLKAWERLRLPDAELVLAGRGRRDSRLLAAFGSKCVCVGDISAEDLQNLYLSSDVFCMPSLVEGFGLVYLEALAHGVPVIATPNTGAADIVQEGREGFIVPIRNVEALAEKVDWCYRNRGALREMSIAARSLAAKYSWARFRDEITGVLMKIEGEGVNRKRVLEKVS